MGFLAVVVVANEEDMLMGPYRGPFLPRTTIITSSDGELLNKRTYCDVLEGVFV